MPDTPTFSQDDIARAVRGDILGTRSAITLGNEQNPDDAARALQLEGTTGVPSTIISGDLEKFETDHKRALAEQLIMSNPQLRGYINSHPMAAAISNDDWGNLDQLSQDAGQTSTMMRALQAPNAAAKAAGRAALEELERPATVYSTQDIGKMFPALDPSKGVLATISNALATGEINLGSIIGQQMSNVFSAMTKGVEAGTTAGAQALGVPDAEKLGRDLGAVAEYQMIKPEPKPEVIIPREYPGGGVHIEQAPPPVDWPGKMWVEGAEEPPAGVHPEIDSVKAQANALLLEQLEKEVGSAQSSLTKERSPEMFQRFVEQHHDESIGISGDAAVALYGDKQPEPTDGLLGWVPNIAQQLEVARSTGADINIPVADLVAKMDPGVLKQLRDDVRTYPGGITAREALFPPEYKELSPVPVEQYRQVTGTDPVLVPAKPDLVQQRLTELESERNQILKKIGPHQHESEKLALEAARADNDNIYGPPDTVPYMSDVEKELHHKIGEIDAEKADLVATKAAETIQLQLPPGYRAIRDVTVQGRMHEDIFGQLKVPMVAVVDREGNLIGRLNGYLLSSDMNAPWYKELLATGRAKPIGEAALDAARRASGLPDGVTDLGFERQRAELEDVAGIVGETTKQKPEGVIKPFPVGAAPSGFPSLFDQLDQLSPETMGLTAKLKAALDKMVNDRYEHDVEVAQKRAEKEQAKRQTKEWKDNRKEMEKDVEAVVRARPSVAADLFVGSGELHGNKVRQRVPILESTLSADQKAQLPDHYYSKTGLPADEMASLFGYHSGDAMVEDLIAHNAMKEGRTPQEMLRHLIDMETDMAMEAKYGNLGENILAEAKDQALSEENLNILADEYYAAGIVSKQPVIDKAAAKEEALRQIGQIPIGQVDSKRLLTLTAKHAQDAVRSLIAQDPAATFVSLQRRYFSALLAKEALKVEKEVGRFNDIAKTLGKRKLDAVDPEYTNFIHQILMAVGKPVRRSVQDLQEQIAAGVSKNLKDFVEAKTAAFREVPVWDQLFDQSWRKPYEQLTVDEFRAVRDSVKALNFNGREELKIYKAGEAADWAKIKGRMVEALEQFPLIDYSKGVPGGAVGHALRRYGYDHMILETILNKWDEFDPKGVWNQYGIRDLIEGSTREDALRKEYARKLTAIADDADLKKRVDNPLFRQPTPDGNGPLMYLNRSHLRSIMLNVGNGEGPKSNLAKLAGGYGLKPDQVMNWIHQHATKEDWNFVQKVWDMFGEIKEQANDMYRSLTGGVAPESIPAMEIQTPFGAFKGGYYPVIHHELFEGKPVHKGALEQNNYVRASPPAGYTKTRTADVRPLALDLDRLPSRIAQELHDIAMRPAVINFSKIIYDKEIRQAILNHAGSEVRDLFEPYLRDVANSANYVSKSQADWSTWSEFIRQNMVTTLVGLNPGTVLKHGPTAFVQSMHETGPINFLKALKGLTSINEETGEKNWDFAINSSLELQRRRQNYIETLAGATQQLVPSGKFDSLRQTVIKIGSKPVAMSDLMSAVPTWLAQYEKSIEAGETKGDAIYLADRAVRRAHGSTAITNRPAVMRDLNPWLTSVYTFFNHIMNRQAEMVWKAGDMLGSVKEGDYKDAMAKIPALSGQLFAYVIFPAIVEELVSPLTNKEDESWGMKAAKGIGFTLGASWVGIRDIASFLASGREPTVGLFSTAAKSATDVYRDLWKKEPFNKEHAARILQDASALAGLATGLVPEQVGRSARFVSGVESGIEHPKGPWGWLVGLRYGTLKHHAGTLENWRKGKNY